MKAKPAPITIPYRLRSHAKAAGNSEPMLAQSAAMDIDGNHLDNSSYTPSPDIDGESLDHLALTPSPNTDEKSLDPFRTPSLQSFTLSPNNYEPFENAALNEVTGPLMDPRSSPLSEVPLSLPSFSSLSLNPLPLRTIDEDRAADFNNLTPSISNPSNLTHSSSPNLLPLYTEDDDVDVNYNDHPTSSDGSNLENELAGPTLSDIHTAERYVESMNSTSYGPKRNSWAAEQSYGRQTRQPTPYPVLAQSINFANPAADNYDTYSFYGNSSQAFPRLAEASDQYRVPLASLQTQPIIQTYEDQKQYGSQYGQPRYSQPQYVQPRTLGFFEPQQNSDSRDAAAAHQNSINTKDSAQANNSRKRKSSNVTMADDNCVTDTPTKRRRRTGQYAASHDRPPATISDDELKGRAVHLFKTDPWLWSVNDVYFSLTNTRSHDLLDNTDNNALPHPHLGLILRKLVIDGPKLLINFTQPFLLGLGITRADHLTATMSLLNKIRARSQTYQHHRHHSLNPIPMASLDTLAPQFAESEHAVLDSVRQDIGSRPLKNGEIRKYHFVFGCFLASRSGTEEGQYTLGFNTVGQCLGMEQRRESMVSQEFDQQRQLDQQLCSEHQQRDKHHRTSVSFVRGPSNGEELEWPGEELKWPGEELKWPGEELEWPE